MDFSSLALDLSDCNYANSAALTAWLDTLTKLSAAERWQAFLTSEYRQAPFAVHLSVFKSLFRSWPQDPSTAYAWQPDAATIAQSNLTRLMQHTPCTSYDELYHWSYTNWPTFWQTMLQELNIVWQQVPAALFQGTAGDSQWQWFPNGKLNIVDSCFQAPADKTALIYSANQQLQTMSYGELLQWVNRIANSLQSAGVRANTVVAIVMPMHWQTVAIYLAIIKLGAIVVSIADSFSSAEIATRIKIAKAALIFTATDIAWDGKTLPLYSKLIAASDLPTMVVLDAQAGSLRAIDKQWETFLVDATEFDSVACEPMQTCHILFSSGTTANPKAIPWNHTTPIKAAVDAHLHHDMQAQDCLAWPTNLGWMMGPWAIFAALINQASLALYTDTPRTRAFGEFVAAAQVTILGLVPTLVSHWRQSACMEGCNWQQIKLFSSTGECSNPQDMLYLMWLGHYKPVIEYCGGTEIGGAYLTSSIMQANAPGTFSTPTLGTELVILDAHNEPAESGEVALVPPVLGLSTTLLNADHHQVYYAGMPYYGDRQLRRHGDEIKRYNNGYYTIQGRSDDAMNLGGIKISSA